MKKTGFNIVRKHLKIEPQRWYYHCDRMGIVVWQDMVNGGGNLKSVHNYFFKLGVRTEKERAYVLSEIGGYTCREEGYCACEDLYGYGAHESTDSLNHAYGKLMEEIEALIPEGLCASVYTQWSDVEEEVNGVYTYDRECRKIREAVIRK